ncbi:MAG: glycerophosphodiester phosphodiesterase [Halobacteriales archaeon SW_9_67_25]|jgi:glycerophosphoryl diester phosphodiesterase|nr:MAG: glycerophosphodiester phosphodiesterase [Halobacteriales archaeon SW_9_67_25]
MNCIAHRGFAATYPENTLAAVRGAVEAGADAVEVDIRRCGSGEVVVIHDNTLDRVTDGAGGVADHSLATLRDLDVLGTGEGVPTLADVVATVPDGVGLNVELKETGLAADALAAADDHGGDLLVSSFETATLREARAAGAESLALLVGPGSECPLEDARTLDCRAVHPYRELCDATFVDRCHDAGFAVNAWTVRSADEARRLGAAAVDGLIADAPAYCEATDAAGTGRNRATD